MIIATVLTDLVWWAAFGVAFVVYVFDPFGDYDDGEGE